MQTYCIHLNLDRDTMQGRLGDYAGLGSDARLFNDRVPMLRKVFSDWVFMLSALVTDIIGFLCIKMVSPPVEQT